METQNVNFLKKDLIKIAKELGLEKISSLNKAQLIQEIEKVKSKRENITLNPYQHQVINYLKDHRGVIAVHPTGSGKTLTAVVSSHYFLEQYPLQKVIVITPKSLQNNFKKEMIAYGINKNDPRYEYYTFSSFEKASAKKLIDCAKALLIVDEAHNLRTQRGKMALSVIKCASLSHKVLLLTATPVVNGLYDIANLIAMVDGNKEVTRTQFNDILGSNAEFDNYFGCKVSIIHPPKDNQNYPSSKVHEVFLEMSPFYLQKYLEIERNNLPYEFFNIFSKSSDLQAFYNGVRRASNNLEMENSPKNVWIMDKIENSTPEQKFVVFSHFIKSGNELLITKLKEKNISYRYINGEISKSERNQIVKDYNQDLCKVLLISKAGSEGLDLKGTTDIIILEPSWNETTYYQVMGRGIRYKSHIDKPLDQRHVNVYRLYLIKPKEKDNLETIIAQNLDSLDQQKLSIDLYLRNFSIAKQQIIDNFLERLDKVSIENRKC